MKYLAILLLSGLLAAAGASRSSAAPEVMVSIKPLHSLVASVMEGAGEPALLVDGAASPHSFSLKPSQARDLERSELVFWIGPDLEAFLEKPLETLGAGARVVTLMEVPGLNRLAFREAGLFGEKREDDHDHDHDHDHGGFDPHIWLDPENAKVLTAAIAGALAESDPDNAGLYRENMERLRDRLDALSADMKTRLEPVRERAFVVFHDAYHHLEARFSLRSVGAISISPEEIAGAARVAEIRNGLKRLEVACVFAEPQFEPKLISVIVEGTGVRSAVLDPLGAALEPGPGLYFELLQGMTESLVGCLSGQA